MKHFIMLSDKKPTLPKESADTPEDKRSLPADKAPCPVSGETSVSAEAEETPADRPLPDPETTVFIPTL